MDGGRDRIQREWMALDLKYKTGIRPLSAKQTAWLDDSRRTVLAMGDLDALDEADSHAADIIRRWRPNFGTPSQLLLKLIRSYDAAAAEGASR